MGRPGMAPLLLVVVVLAGCASVQLDDVPPHSELRGGELLEVSPTGRVEVVAQVPGDTNHAVVVADGVVIEIGGSILASEGGDFVETDSGILLASDRLGERYATISGGVLTIHEHENQADVPVPCDRPLAGVWDGSNTVVGVLCDEELFVVDPSTDQVFSRSLPGVGVDISNWGEGFAVLVRTNDGLALYRTSCHEQDIFGLLYSVSNEDIIEIVAGIDEEGWVALASDGTLLNFTGEDFEVIGEEVTDISEVPGVQLEFECVLGAMNNG